MAKQKTRDPLAWGIILIAVGVILLLAINDVNVWNFIARLWPLILVVWGAWKFYFGIKERKEEERLE
jgi:hypothetical protein